MLIEKRYLLIGEELAKVFPWILSQDKVRAGPLGSSPIEIGFVAAPLDWTDEDY